MTLLAGRRATAKRARGQSMALVMQDENCSSVKRLKVGRGVLKKPPAAILRKRLYFKQPDPSRLPSSAKLLVDVDMQDHWLLRSAEHDETFTVGHDCPADHVVRTPIGHTLEMDVHSSEGEDLSSTVGPCDAVGVSSAQLALTLLLSTMSAAQAQSDHAPREVAGHSFLTEPSPAFEINSHCGLPSRAAPSQQAFSPAAASSSSSPPASGNNERRCSMSSSSSSSSTSSSEWEDMESAANAPGPASPTADDFSIPAMSEEANAQCVEKLQCAILARMPKMPRDGSATARELRACQIGCNEVTKVSQEIAMEFSTQWTHLKSPRVQLRTLLFNLRDPQNPDFVRLVATRKIAPRQLPWITSEEMASTAKRSERQVLRERHVQETTLRRSLSGMVDQGALQAYKAMVSRK